MKIIYNPELFDLFSQKYHIFSIFPQTVKEDMDLRYYDKQEYVFHQGFLLEGFYYQLEGTIKIFCTLKSGNETNLRFCSSQRIYGGSEFFLNLPASASALTMTPAYYLYLPFSKCRTKLMKDANFLFDIGKNYAEIMHVSNNNFAINQSTSHESRVAAYILSISDDIIFPGGFKEIPGYLGISYRHLLRILNSFITQKLIVKDGKNYRILNIDLLRELAEDIYFI